MLVIFLFIHHDQTKEPTPPRALERKIRFIRSAAQSVKRIKKYKAGLFKIADLIHAAKEDRHDIVHGGVAPRGISTLKSKELVRIVTTGSMPEVKTILADTTQLLQKTVDVMQLAIEVDKIATKIVSDLQSLELTEEQIQKQVRHLLPIVRAFKQ